jgi:murein DD-endopeptidase MepM/ murein hydrolase activator NlpD
VRTTLRPTALVAAVLLALTALPAVAQSTEIEPAPEHLPQTPRVDITPQVVDLTFPVADPHLDVRFSDDFLHLRGGGSRLHAATDLMAPKHRPVHAAVGGVVSYAPFEPGRAGWSALGEPSWGWMLTILGDDGLRYSYVHLNNDTPARGADGTWSDDDAGGVEHAYAPRIAAAVRNKGASLYAGDGIRVERGELLGWNGDSGNAKGIASHLHLEIEIPHPDGAYRINPYHSLVDALERGDVVTAAPAPPPPPSEPETSYLDLDPDGVHTGAVLRLLDAGVLRDCAPEHYCPHVPITRDDIAAAVAAALGLDPAAALVARGGTGFTDVPLAHRDAGAIAAVAHAGVLRGYGDGRFGPDDRFSREQLATALTQAFRLPAAREPAPFVDVGPTAVHGATIAAAHAAGLTVGCGDGSRFCGRDHVSRGQLASFLESGLAWDG